MDVEIFENANCISAIYKVPINTSHYGAKRKTLICPNHFLKEYASGFLNL